MVGDKVYLGSILGVNIHAYGNVSDLDTPDQVAYTIEGYGPNALLDFSVLQGQQGIPGSNAPLGHHQFPIYDSVDDLPTNLTNDPVDIGKYWIIRQWDNNEPPNQIGSWWYMWDGNAFEQFKMGEPGQIGPVPSVTPVFQLVNAADTVSWGAVDQGNGYRIIKTGSDYNPVWTIQVNKELLRGPAGVGSSWALYKAGGEAVGNVPIWDGAEFAPGAPVVKVPKFWTFPEGSFQSNPLAEGTRVPIGSAQIPQIPWDTVPYVQGHFRLTGIEFDASPFIIGVECRLGNATSGPVVARGYGNITGYVNLQPHASTAQTSSDAITPDNGRAVIPANTVAPAARTLYVNAYNDGLAGFYNFDATGAQLSVLAVPV